MFNPDDDDSYDDSDGIPRLPPPPAMTAEPTDKTVRGFVLPMDDAAPLAAPDAPTTAMEMPEAIADGSIDQDRAPGVPTAAEDAATMAVTPLDVGYRYAVLRQVAALANQGTHGQPGLRRLAAQLAVEVRVDPDDHARVVVCIRRWRDFAAWVRREALDDFVVLKGTLAGWPPVIKSGARAVLRQLAEACHRPAEPAPDGFVYLWL